MPTATVEHRVSLLLKLLGDEFTSTILEDLPNDRQGRVRAALSELEEDEPSDREIDDLLDEFESLLRIAVQFSGDLGDAGGQSSASPETSARKKKTKRKPPRRVFEEDDEEEDEDYSATGDLKRDLNAMPPERLAAVLENEEPTTIALILQAIHMTPAGEVLELLPEASRELVFHAIRTATRPHEQLLERALRVTLDMAIKLDTKALRARGSDAEGKLAMLLRAMSRKPRIELLRAIATSDAEAAERIRDQLYQVGDIAKLEDRSIQRLLGAIDTSTLAVALKKADETVAERVLGNLSKRASAALKEEMEYMNNVEDDALAEANKTLVRSMIELDEQGELNMIGED